MKIFRLFLALSVVLGLAAGARAQTTIPISGLPAAGPITGTEIVPVVQNGVTRRTTVSGLIGGLAGATWFDSTFCNTVGYLIVRTTGAWVCSKSVAVNPDWWGADRTGTNDSSSAFATMFSAIGTGKHVDIGDGIYKVCGLSPPQNTWISGQVGFPELYNDFVNAPTGLKTNPYNLPSQLRATSGCLALINAVEGLAVSNLIAVPSGLSLPATNNTQATTLLGQYNSTFLAGDKTSVYVHDVGAFGFYTVATITNTGGTNGSLKCNFERIVFDAINGISCSSSGERSYIRRNYGGTFLTIGISGLSTANGERSGTCIYVFNSTATSVDQNFCFGYNYAGAQVDSSNTRWTNNHFETLGSASDIAAINITKSSGHSEYPYVAGNWLIGYGRGVYVDLTGASSGKDTATIIGNQIINPASAWGIEVAAGSALIQSNFVQNGAFGIRLDAGATGGGIILGNRFQGQTSAAISNAATSTTTWVIEQNLGYNPVGVSTGTYSVASTSTYTAGPTKETHYLTGGTVTAVKVPSGGTTICTTTPCFVDLGANETMSVTYSGAPTDTKSIH